MKKPLVIGLTGGIGAGKTTVANLFAELGVPVIDTDHIARRLLNPTTENLQKLVAQLGKKILTTHNELDRKQLRQLVFADPLLKAWLEALLHPQVRQQLQQEIAAIQDAYCIVVVPLLIEKYPYPLIDRILVVDASPAQQIKRTTQRDQLDESQVNAIIATQASREQRLALANDLIINDSNELSVLKQQVSDLHAFYQQQARLNSH